MKRSSVGWIVIAVIALIAFVVTAPAAQAFQGGTISGRVTDASTGLPLQGARIMLVGTNKSATTDGDGRFQLRNVADGPTTIRVVMIGYESYGLMLTVVGGISSADFRLNKAVITLDEIVVTATGEQRKREIANAIGTVDVASIVELAPAMSIDEVLAGQTPGVTLLRSSGTVGVGSNIKIRGNSSISLTNHPLVYLDGARIDNDNNEGPGVGGQDASRLNDINPDDIERIEIVKGPAASTLYGTEAAAGVILIYTKRGRRAPPEWTFRTDFGANIRSTYEYPANVWDPASFGFPNPNDTLHSMNLMEEFNPFRSGYFRSYQGSVRGGTDLVKYYFSGQFQNEDGTLPNNSMTRHNGRANFTITPTNDLWDVQLNTGYTSNFLTLPDNDNNGFGYIGVAMIGFPWNHKIFAADPNTGGTPIETCPFAFELARSTGNPLSDGGCPANNKGGFFGNRSFADVETLGNVQNVERFTGSATMRIRPTTFWSNRITLGYDLVAQRTSGLIPVDPTRPFGAFSDGFRDATTQTVRNLTLDYSGSVSFDLSSSINSVTSIGVQYYREVLDEAGCTGEVFPAGATTCSSAVTTTGNEAFVEAKTLGVYLQQQISINDRLFLTPAIRLDDNSAFGTDFSLAKYPKVGASYMLIDQGFGPIDQAKLRVAWGKSGKQPTNFAALQRFNASKVSIRTTNVLGVTPLNLGNQALSPEIGAEWEVGFDVGLFDNRVGLEATYYTQKTTDAIVLTPLAPSLGFPDPVFINIARIDNKGIELALDIAALTNPDFTWNWSIKYSTNSNEIKDLEEDIFLSFGSSQRHTDGFPFASYFSERIIIDPVTGDAMVDPTSDPDDDDHVFLGQPTPEWEGSVTSTLTLLRNLTIHAFLDFKGGHKLFNSTEEFRCGFLGGGATGSICPETFERDADGEFTDEAKIKQLAAQIGAETPWVEDATFAKLRTVSLRFQFPESWAQALHARRASLTLSGHNLKTWTGYTGADPEINNFGQNGTSRAEFLTLPTNRRFTASMRVTF